MRKTLIVNKLHEIIYYNEICLYFFFFFKSYKYIFSPVAIIFYDVIQYVVVRLTSNTGVVL